METFLKDFKDLVVEYFKEKYFRDFFSIQERISNRSIVIEEIWDAILEKKSGNTWETFSKSPKKFTKGFLEEFSEKFSKKNFLEKSFVGVYIGAMARFPRSISGGAHGGILEESLE